ncbi:beta-carotene ketolase CrtW [Chlorogloeopsis fritschii]|uniref:beta-carotene ketolase CrtW n=1 Tax=Chlorogloeopsis fritschii TaxID=1124 RepID=UPI00370D9E4D
MLQLTLEFDYMRSISLNICDCPLFNAVEFKQIVPKKDSIAGLIVALLIITIWAASLSVLLYFDVTKFSNWLIPIAIIWQTFLYTGLFITAHDAMHGAVYRKNIKINNFIGSLSVILYAFFSYRQLLKKHWLHHHHPASENDPDFHDGQRINGIFWYFHFMKEYWSWHQFIGMTIIFNLAKYTLQISNQNLILFWIIPPILSSIQLFYFGTFLPHREPKEGYVRPHCAQTIPLPVFWSFITCYHFGYHQEHHEFPQVPWWQLPSVYKQKIQ